jgi:RNA polymerase sigma factor (sigma-70 family)
VRTELAAREDLVAALFREHYAGLLRWAALLSGQERHRAEELVMDAFAGLLRRRGALDDPAAALGYVRMSVLNGSRTRWRRRALERTSTEVLAARASMSGGPEDDVIVERSRVMAALARLPERQRVTVILRYYADLPEQEIAALMRVSPGTVKSQLAKARSHLAKDLDHADTLQERA